MMRTRGNKGSIIQSCECSMSVTCGHFCFIPLKVHVLNSFFHRQLITKGYDGVRRWTRQVCHQVLCQRFWCCWITANWATVSERDWHPALLPRLGRSVFQEFAFGAHPPGGPLVPGGGQQHKEEDLPVRLSGHRSAEGGQGKQTPSVSMLFCTSRVALFKQANSSGFAAVTPCNRQSYTVTQSWVGGGIDVKARGSSIARFVDTSATKWTEERIANC